MNFSALIIDDDEIARSLVSENLKALGLTIFTLSNSLHIEEFLKINKVNLIVCDIVMPDRDGIETVKIIKNTHPEIVFVAMTAYSSTYLESISILGAELVFSKDDFSFEICKKIVEFLSLRHN